MFYLVLVFAGCGLFKKTTITGNKESKSTSKQLEANMLMLKNANKETQVFTYWTDSGFYQVAQIKEQTDLAKSGRLTVGVKHEVKHESKIKKKEPAKLWVYIGIVIAVFGLCIVGMRLFAFYR
ncbi:hypothetical protein [Pedobacter sp. AK017]|uniref:hypothetical protein n=1 Tax=Pedobacter sp. AK017 TaxID=2723073 RepID=UPI00161052E5|nr:hypothetical protein [Pedobacter sp. AK017]